MGRVLVPPITPIGPFPSLQPAALSLDFVWQAADAGNKQYCPIGREVLLLAWNSGAVGRTVTVTSVADSHNRTGDVTAYAIGAGLYSVIGRYGVEGWGQADGSLYFEASHADVKFLVLKLS